MIGAIAEPFVVLLHALLSSTNVREYSNGHAQTGQTFACALLQ